MATTTERQQRTALALQGVELMVADLPQVADEWEHLSDGEQMGWSLDWSNEMSKLQRLSNDATTGLLTRSQQDRYRDVIGRLRDALPSLKRLDLYVPPIVQKG